MNCQVGQIHYQLNKYVKWNFEQFKQEGLNLNLHSDVRNIRISCAAIYPFQPIWFILSRGAFREIVRRVSVYFIAAWRAQTAVLKYFIAVFTPCSGVLWRSIDTVKPATSAVSYYFSAFYAHPNISPLHRKYANGCRIY